MPQTRIDGLYPVFGVPSELLDTVLPTCEDAMKYYLWIRQMFLASSVKESSVTKVSTELKAFTRHIKEELKMKEHSNQQELQIQESSSSDENSDNFVLSSVTQSTQLDQSDKPSKPLKHSAV
ncbi:hypothetical protein ILUMI_16579 [Ignelater luminosus]|uniref:Uncharacterized protein n=1 Tax=Ignelater luminosus TaxID=2038154 RepID=A0A8K0CNB4_IGNLU|nr:hypothetical protein ILUMI_16579 [Ignelater luminosus]